MDCWLVCYEWVSLSDLFFIFDDGGAAWMGSLSFREYPPMANQTDSFGRL